MAVVGIVGAGLIGRSWSVVFARAGWDVKLYDVSQAALDAAPGLIAEGLADLAAAGLGGDPAAEAKRVTVTGSLAEAVSGVEHVQENSSENVDVKTALFAELDGLVPGDAVIASSTSAIVASRFTADMKTRERCLVAHPVNPPHLVPIVELCGAPWTTPETLARARETFTGLGQVPITVNAEVEGFVLNRLQGALLSEALRLAEDGVASPEDIDATIKHGLGLRWSFLGPFETIELNAPGGVADYCARYSGFYRRLAAEAPAPEVWDEAKVERVLGDFGLSRDPEGREARRLWRDRRLAALMAHKKGQPDAS
jgi:3-hydroxyacyl-CoA dehydrogenase